MKNYTIQLFGAGVFVTTHYYFYKLVVLSDKTKPMSQRDIPPPKL